MSLRKLRVLVENLPVDSATARARRQTHWTDVEYLLADVCDLVAYHRWEWARAHDAALPEPKPVRRPGEPEPADKRDELAAAHDEIMRQLTRGTTT